MRALFLAGMDRTDDDFKIVRNKAVQFEREKEDEDDVEGNHVSTCARGHGFTNDKGMVKDRCWTYDDNSWTSRRK